MSPGRSHKPLFEHLAKGRAESLPSGRPVRVDGPPRAGRVSLSYVGLYGIVAGGLLAAVVCWSVGYRVGYGRGEAAWLADYPAGRDEYPLDPLSNEGGSGTRSDGGGDGAPDQAGADRAGTDRGSGDRGPARVLTARGPVDRDPRQAGYNYLELATLSREQAQAALVFLAGQGVEAIAAPLDSGGGGANNPARYRLVSIGVAIPSEQFRAMRTARLDHEGLIERLGRVWQKDHKGASDFASPLWKRYP